MAEATWIRIQRKTFTRWANTFLINRNLGIHILEQDLQDGVILHNLLEILSGRPLKPKASKQKMKVQKVEQINRAIRFMQSWGLKVVAIGGEDIHDGNIKLILGLLWILILRFQIEADTGASASELLDWCNKVLKPQGVSVDNFKDSWQDGRAFCGLVNALEPHTINLEECPSENKMQNLNLAFSKAEEKFQFPKMLDAEDILEYPDDLSIMTYVAYYRGYLATNTADPNFTYCEGEGLKSGLVLKPAEFTIIVKNDKNEKAERGGAPIRCFLRDENDGDICRVNIFDNRNGTYSCNYEAPRPGKFFLHVRVGPNPIKDSPYRPDVISGEPFPGKCAAIGPGSLKAVAGQLTEFKIQAKDSNGNNLDKGGGQFSAILKDPKGPVTIKIKDNEDGTYTGSYVATTAGEVPLIIEVKTEAFGEGPIEGSPYPISVVAGAPVASFTTASGPGMNGANAGTTGVVIVQTRDEFQNELKVGGSPINATLSSKADGRILNVEVIDKKDGTYELHYVPEKVGKYCLEIRLGDQPIKNSPVEFSVLPGVPDPLQFEFSGIDLDPLDNKRHVVAGTTDTYKILARDAYGNVIKNGGSKIDVKIDGASTFLGSAVDKGDGTYEISYKPTKAGDHRVSVEVNGVPLRGAHPLPVLVVAAAPSGGNSVAHGKALEIARLESEDNVFTVEARDAFDNPVPVGGAAVAGKLTFDSTGETLNIVSTDKGDGTYVCTYPGLTKAGKYTVTPTLNGVPVKGAPFKLFVNPGGALLSNTEITFSETTIVGLAAGKVQLVDSRQNPLLTGGDVVEADALSLTPLQVKVKDNHNGTYEMIYPPNVHGTYEVSLVINDTPISSGPWTVTISPNPLTEEEKKLLHTLLPGTQQIFGRLLEKATPPERLLILKELQAAKAGKVLTDAEVNALKLPAEGPTATLLL